MASQAVAAAETAIKELPRRFGTKQVFLPKAVVAFLRPKPKQPPNLATFAVPMEFNKLDLRDYLYHAYNVEVLSVRAYIQQPPPERRGGAPQGGRWYRPKSKKFMIAELAKPFVWPEPVPESDREAFDHKIWQKIEDHKERANQRGEKPGHIPLRKDEEREYGVSREREVLKELAKEYLESGEWKGPNSGKWTEVEKELDAEKKQAA
ncbi:hypothetical protein VTJ83DRAFT_4932 [Remersonia thermophila]|uniref:Large ribosomal subunit protein uL23m n=1 Tax=Remersonia thermophila TaxID=72144 RepID=A0ABR4DBC5_9PEZI